MDKNTKRYSAYGTPRVEAHVSPIAADLAAGNGWLCEAAHPGKSRPHARSLVLLTVNGVDLDVLRLCPACTFQVTTGVGY